MKLNRKTLGAAVIGMAALIFLAGCRNPINAAGDRAAANGDGSQSGLAISRSVNTDAYNGYYVDGGTKFVPQGNPLFNIRNSSDPAICVYHQPAINKDVLMMVTSCDLSNTAIPDAAGNYYPMNATYLYTTSNFDGKWYDHGVILDENDLSTNNGGWSKPNANNLWAPDIQYSASEKKFYLYVPDVLPDGTQRIGVAIANENTSMSPVGPYNMLHGLCDKFVPQKSYLKINNSAGGTPPPHGGYSYDPGVFYDDAKQTYYLAYCDHEYDDGRLNIAKMTNMTTATYIGKIKFATNDPGDMYMEGPDISSFTVGGVTRYYLQFAAKADDGTERIGYAMATPDEFRKNPDSCWNFKGWVMKDVLDQESNPDHWTNHADFCTYNGRPYIFYHKIVKDPAQYPGSHNRQVCAEELTLDPSTGEIVGAPLSGTSTGPFVQRLRNDQSDRYLTVTSSGDKPIAVCQATHGDWGSQQWSPESVMPANNPAPPTQPFDMKGTKKLKDNWTGNYLTVSDSSDYAEVVGKANSNGNDQQWLVENNSDGTFRLKNSYSGYYLTCTDTYEGAGIRAQLGHSEWSSQNWRLNGNRFVNAWSGKDLTMTGKNYASVRAQPLNESWGSQKWVVETTLGSDGGYRVNLRNFWSGKYLYEYYGNAVCLQEGGLTSIAWALSTVNQDQIPSRAVRLMNANAGTYLTATGDSGSVDYANVMSQSWNGSSNQIWHFQ